MKLISAHKGLPLNSLDVEAGLSVFADPQGNLSFQVFNGWSWASVKLSKAASQQLVDDITQELFAEEEDGQGEEFQN